MVLLLVAGSLSVRAQHIAINNNLLFDVAGALSAGVEIPIQKSSTLEVYGSIRPWKRGDDRVHKHWTVQAQYRLWPCQVMNGFFWGPYVHGGQFNFGNEELLFGLLKGLKPNRYEGWLLGGGIGIGYDLTAGIECHLRLLTLNIEQNENNILFTDVLVPFDGCSICIARQG